MNLKDDDITHQHETKSNDSKNRRTATTTEEKNSKPHNKKNHSRISPNLFVGTFNKPSNRFPVSDAGSGFHSSDADHLDWVVEGVGKHAIHRSTSHILVPHILATPLTVLRLREERRWDDGKLSEGTCERDGP